MSQTIEFLKNYSSQYPVESLFQNLLGSIASDGFFSVLSNKNYLEFHKKLLELAKYPHGVGLAVSIMAQINIAGQILAEAKKNGSKEAEILLAKVEKGEATISAGISEKGWRGRLANLKTNLQEKNGKILLIGEKSFFTNGKNSSHFLVLAKDEFGTNLPVLVPADSQNIEIFPFRLSFAQEATHCRIILQDQEIEKDWILPIDYNKFGEELRLGEMLSVSAIFCGFAKKMQSSLFKIIRQKELDSPKWKTKLFEWNLHLEMFQARVEKISTEKSNKALFSHITHYPFGLEILVKDFLVVMEEFFSRDELILQFPDLGLFLWDDPLNQFFYSKSQKRFFQVLIDEFS